MFGDKREFTISVEWIGGPMDGDCVQVDAEADFVEHIFELSGNRQLLIDVPIEFRENGKPVIFWTPEFSHLL